MFIQENFKHCNDNIINQPGRNTLHDKQLADLLVSEEHIGGECLLKANETSSPLQSDPGDFYIMDCLELRSNINNLL